MPAGASACDPLWSVVQEGFDPRTFQAYEGLFTLGSGYLHVRGSLEESLAIAPQNETYTRRPANVTSEAFRSTVSTWGTYVPGVFGPHPLLNNQMINLPWFLGFELELDGVRFSAESADAVVAQRRTLCLDTATLIRDVDARCAGRQVRLRFERFVSAARPHLCVQRVCVSCDEPVRVDVRPFIDGDVRTNGHDHFEQVDLDAGDDGVIRCRLTTDGGDRVSVESRCFAREAGIRDVRDRRQATPRQWEPWRGARGVERVAGVSVVAEMAPGEEFRVEKHTEVRTSRDLDPPAGGNVQATDYDTLHAEHAAVWRGRWSTCDVVIEGDDAAQRAMRVGLFHLLRSHVPDSRVAVDAKGYAGEAYWGRYFWDTEMFLLPFHVYTDPPRARTLVEFRVGTLDGARANAARYGYPGARYAWEADAQGLECCPNWQYADHEVHVTADVVYGIAHYHAAVASDESSGMPNALADGAFWPEEHARVVVETARYWLARIDWVTGPAAPGVPHRRPVLLGVMGPDEYTPISSNNAYTNRMVAFALDVAAAVGLRGGATPAECAAFAEVARGLVLPRRPDGLVLQCDEFESFAEPRFETLWLDRDRTFAAQVSQERLYRSKCLKQGDVLMLMALFPHEFGAREIEQAWNYYLPYTTHDSSLSPGVHAVVAARMGRLADAERLWRMAAGIDLDVAGGGARQGIHIANAGALWQVAVFGFAGMRTALQSRELTLCPRLPAGWKRLEFPIVWNGARALIGVHPDRAVIHNKSDRVLHARVWDQPQTIPPTEQSTWKR